MLCAGVDFAEFDTAAAENGLAAADWGRGGYTRFVSYREIEALLESAGYSAEEIDYDWAGAGSENLAWFNPIPAASPIC